MLPSLAQLTIDPLETSAKRKFSDILRSQALRSGFKTVKYKQLIQEIIDDIKNIILPDTPSVESIAVKELQKRLQESPIGAFSPSYESQHVSIPKNGIDSEIAKRIAAGFFQSNKYASELGKIQNVPVVIVEHFVQNNYDLIKTFAYAAVGSFMSLPSSSSQPLLRASVQLVMQIVDQSSYYPIVDNIHMDYELDMLHPRGNRYGRPASEQDVSSLVATFCADQQEHGRIVLSS